MKEAMKTNNSPSLQDAMQILFPDVRGEISAFIQAFELEMIPAAARKN